MTQSNGMYEGKFLLQKKTISHGMYFARESVLLEERRSVVCLMEDFKGKSMYNHMKKSKTANMRIK